jgi:hypothetical protein
MDEFTIREAAPADVPQLMELTSVYVGLNYRWDQFLGGGRNPREPLALVASDSAGVGAMIAVGAPTPDAVWERPPEPTRSTTPPGGRSASWQHTHDIGELCRRFSGP